MMSGLSEILLSEGLVTRAQLDEALEAQAVYGGNLDTCILELGFLSERDLEPLLGRVFGLPKTGQDWLEQAPTPEVLTLVSANEAARWRVVPWRREDRTLDVMTTGPLSKEVQATLASRSEKTLRPHVVTEARFALLLEQHYAIACPPRFRTLLDGGRDASGAIEFSSALDDPTEPAIPIPNALAPQGSIIAERVRNARDPAEEAIAEFSTDAPTTALRTLDESLRAVTTRDEIGAAIFPFLLVRAQRAALFVARPTLVLGWDAAGPGVEAMRVQTLCFPLRHPSMFQEAAQGDLFVGPVPFTPVNEEVIRRMGEPRMSRAVVAPIRLRGRLCVFLLADFESDRALEQGFSIVGDVAERVSRTLLRLAAQAAGKTRDGLKM